MGSEEERFLMEVPLSLSVKTKATAILSSCLYDECSGSSRNKYPKGIFWSDYLLSLDT